jgi:hypothetical protein
VQGCGVPLQSCDTRLPLVDLFPQQTALSPKLLDFTFLILEGASDVSWICLILQQSQISFAGRHDIENL